MHFNILRGEASRFQNLSSSKSYFLKLRFISVFKSRRFSKTNSEYQCNVWEQTQANCMDYYYFMKLIITTNQGFKWVNLVSRLLGELFFFQDYWELFHTQILDNFFGSSLALKCVAAQIWYWPGQEKTMRGK